MIAGKKKKHIQDNISSHDRIIYNILLAGMLLIPLMIKAVIIKQPGPFILDYIYHSSITVDMFNYSKFILLVIFTVILLSVFLIKFFSRGYSYSWDKATITWALLYACALISFLLADYKYFVLTGHLFEGTISYLCYLFTFFICVNISYEYDRLKYIPFILMIYLAVNAFLGLLFFAGIDILHYQWFVKLISSPPVIIAPGSFISSTFNNPNYASGIAAILFMVFFGLTLTEKHNKKWLYLGSTGLAFAFLLTSLSSSGFVAVVIIIPIALILLSRFMPFKKILIPFILVIALCTGIYIPMVRHNPQVYSETFGLFIQTFGKIGWVQRVAYAEEFRTSEGIERLNSTNPDDALEEVFGLPKPGISAGSGRTYIWRKTWELIKERPFFGYGLGSLELYVDNNDLQKVAGLWYENSIITKPHSYYLSIAYGIGIPGLLLFLALVFYHVVDMFRLWMKKNQSVNYIQLSLFLGVLTFMVQALFNDTVIGMSLIFWIIFGVSVGVVKQMQRANNE